MLKRCGLEKKPDYVILTFYPAFDIEQLANSIEGRKDKSVAKFAAGSGPFFSRYAIAVQQTSKMLIDGGWTALQLGLQQIIGSEAIPSGSCSHQPAQWRSKKDAFCKSACGKID